MTEQTIMEPVRVAEIVIEPYAGGRWLEVAADGSTCVQRVAAHAGA